MRIALDAMGGDHAPRETVLGAFDGLAHLAPDDALLLYGPQERVEAECRAHNLSDPRVSIVHCSQTIEMDDSPVEALKQKRDSALVKMAGAAGKGDVHAIISAGNTGAFVAACQLRIKPIAGVSRPGIAVTMPTFAGPAVICDVGANVSPKPHHLLEYAQMCTIFARAMLGIPEPKVGIVSIGEEEVKGNALVREAGALIRGDNALNFIGNVEGRDIFAGTGNVYVCDGFVGNVILKLAEGMAEGLFRTIVNELREESPDLVRQFQPVVDRIWRKHDFAEYGGAPLLGINSVAIICHGRSDRRAIGNAIRAARNLLRVNLNGVIADHLAKHNESPA